MQSNMLRLLAVALIAGCNAAMARADAIPFGPTPYLQSGDTPVDFYCPECPLSIEDFEDSLVDPFLTIDSGNILEPNHFSGLVDPVTDSVDGDDGSVDGNGNGGHSWFSQSQVITVSFQNAVTSAGLVFTDGDSVSTGISLEAFNGTDSVGLLNAGDLADDFFTGQTDEDRFLGFRDLDGITSIRISMSGGSGIEIDHVQWQDCSCVPEPHSLGLGLVAFLGILPRLRRRCR